MLHDFVGLANKAHSVKCRPEGPWNILLSNSDRGLIMLDTASRVSIYTYNLTLPFKVVEAGMGELVCIL